MSPGPVVRAHFVAVLAGCACSEGLYPDLTVPPENDQIIGSVAAPTDGCPSWPKASDYGELSIDFENMMTPRDGFTLGELEGIVVFGAGTGAKDAFVRGGYGEPSKRSLLLTFGERQTGLIHLSWKECLNALTRSGVSFWAKGEPTTLSVNLQLAIGAADADCPAPAAIAPLTTEWQLFEYSWSQFCPLGPEAPDFPRKLIGISFNTLGTSADSWLAIDDVTFTQP